MMSRREELFEHKHRAMQLMDVGVSWQEANEQSGLNYSKSGIQRLYREWCKCGDEALIDYRHGHSHKATSEVREWMGERCTEESEVHASQLTVEIEAQFGVKLDAHYVTVLRRQLGLPVPRPGHPGKQQETEPASREAQDTAPATELEGDFSP
jgi:transposase